MKIDLSQHGQLKPLHPEPNSSEQQLAKAKEVQETFRKFVGESFFGQLMKSMRSTQGKPAYFHGGHAEEVFQSQLDQTLAQEMTASSADKIADPMFRQQFPAEAAILQQHTEQSEDAFADLQQLRRR